MPYPLPVACLLGLLACAPTLAADLSAEAYGFPLENPFEATIAGTPPDLRPELPADDEIRQDDHSLLLRPEREHRLPANFWAVKKLRYRLARQDGPAPLIFIIAGTGAHYAAANMELLKKVFYQGGFHVVQLSSPTSYDFMAAASRSATPGLSSEDADDLYRVMQAIMANHPRLEVSGYHLTGYSLGGLHAAFVSHLDEQRRHFNFRRVLMINPPVNLYTSVTNLDRLVQTQVADVHDVESFYERMFDKITRYFQQKGSMDLNAALLFDFQQSGQRLSDEEMAMLIGTSFRFSAADIVFTSDLINRRGLITPPDYPISEGTRITPFFQQALMCDFDCYMAEQLVPLWRKRFDGGSLPQLVHAVSLYALEDYLRGSDKIAAMHNADDIILGPGDLGFLRRTLGERLTLYPRGGHCGNMDYRVNTQAMLDFMRQ
ncbi:MAG TPA: serine/threonine protein kinase [Pseudomonas sp.]|nr:serine/threonine protein kinase [Pseudomonas sp.]